MKLQWTVALKVTIEPFRIDPAHLHIACADQLHLGMGK
jgi:hypothetical protein